MKPKINSLFAVTTAVTLLLSACAADKQSNKPPPADTKNYPEGLYATSSVVFFRAGKEGPEIRLQSLVIGDADAAEQDDTEKQTAPAAPAVGNKCPLSTVSPQPAATGAKLLQP